MAEITRENLLKLDRGINKLFEQAMKERGANDLYKLVATIVKSQNPTNSYTWLGDFPAMNEWVDKRQLAELQAHVYEISKKDWETSFSVSRDDITFNSLGSVKIKVEALAEAVIDHYNALVVQLINSNGICYDGKNFFGEHTKGKDALKKTYNNKSGYAFIKDNVFKVISEMQGIMREDGETSFGVKPNVVIYAPDLHQQALKITKGVVDNGSTNEAKDVLTPISVSGMKAGTWAVLDCTRSLKPFIIQVTKEAKSPERNDGDLFKQKKVHYGVDTMDNAGYGLWEFAHFCDGSGAVTEPEGTGE